MNNCCLLGLSTFLGANSYSIHHIDFRDIEITIENLEKGIFIFASKIFLFYPARKKKAIFLGEEFFHFWTNEYLFYYAAQSSSAE